MPAEDGRGLALLISGIDHFAATQHDDFRALVHVLNATADAWWERQRRFYALFIDKGPLAGADIWLPVIRKPADMQPAHG